MASPEDLFQRLVESQKKVDSDNLITSGVTEALRPNCDISAALHSALTGDNKTFGAALSNAEDSLRSTAKQLQPLSEKKIFRRGIKLLPELSAATRSIFKSEPRSGDDLLAGIGFLANQSAEALAAIRNGKGGQDELEIVIRNNGLISQLIFAFYTSVSS